ncbi:hypothetical protein [Propionibacterium freudenreichii]|uniref:hypothetical protein n=2 Tax=Propionibacterium freudenreichii TaxID=1744 RepID=UPI000762C57F|nr:hypothetical protein [Propionibacterium freudenreichii]
MLHQMVVVQTGDLTGLISRFNSSLPCGGELLYFRVEEDVEGLAGLAVDMVVVLDVELLEERLVGDPPERVVDAHVELVAVAGELQTVIEVSFGLVVFDVACFDLGVEEGHAPCDLVLLLLHQVQWHGSFEVGVQEFGASVVEVVAFGEVGAAFAL